MKTFAATTPSLSGKLWGWIVRRRIRTVILPERSSSIHQTQISELQAQLTLERSLRRRAEAVTQEVRTSQQQLLAVLDEVRTAWSHVPSRLRVPSYVTHARELILRYGRVPLDTARLRKASEIEDPEQTVQIRHL